MAEQLHADLKAASRELEAQRRLAGLGGGSATDNSGGSSGGSSSSSGAATGSGSAGTNSSQSADDAITDSMKFVDRRLDAIAQAIAAAAKNGGKTTFENKEVTKEELQQMQLEMNTEQQFLATVQQQRFAAHLAMLKDLQNMAQKAIDAMSR
jgi:hypothetical protein